MKVVARISAVLLVAVAAFLLFAVVNALASDDGARVGVCIGYVVGSMVLAFSAFKLWNVGRGESAQAA
jgi:hypothetical protein